MRSSALLPLLAFFWTLVLALDPTDSIQDADVGQSGYLDNHLLHPSTVGSAAFGILWKINYGNQKEKWYGRPLVYTPANHSQIVFTASSMNNIRVLDAVNGTVLAQRTVQPPFLQSDIGCTDIPDYIGITGTPILDPNTDTVYFFSKGYKNGASSGGLANGIYQFYAVDVLTLQDKPGFPVLIDGHFADNDNSRYFIGGTVLQRPALTMINGYVVGGFGGHCDLFNYTGMLVSVSTTPNVGVVSVFSMEASPGAPSVVTDITVQEGGKAGIWQGGMGLATDGNRFYLATGNGQGHANGDVPASGRQPMSTLDEVVGSFSVDANGKITLADYFEPFEYVSMDAGDRDLGSAGVQLLDAGTFQGTGVTRIAVSIGKNGKAYIMNANNLGGFKQGAGGTDNVIQTIIADGAVFGGSGSYPLEGGYLYFTPVGFPTAAYKFGHDSNGLPLFTLVGKSATNSAGRVGIGIPTITSYKGQAGTGIIWVADPSNGLQAFEAVPTDGVLQPIPLPPTGGLNKFIRPAFGNGRVYVSDSNGNLMCLGAPVSLPLQCSQQVDFGSVNIGSTETVQVNCTALIPITSVNGCATGNAEFVCDNSTLPKGPVAQGAQFSFPVTWNLTQSTIQDEANASTPHVLPGAVSTNLDLYTTNGVAKYSNIVPISLTGTTVSLVPFLEITPPEVDFGLIVIGSDDQQTGLDATFLVTNAGSQDLTILGTAWTNRTNPQEAPVVYTNISNGDLGAGFTSSSIPQAGDVIPAGSSISVPVNFLQNATSLYTTFVQFWTNGGDGDVLLTGSASTAPIANISVSTVEGGWDYIEPLVLDFDDVLDGKTAKGYIQICNSGGSVLTITKSKPPIDSELLAPNAATDLHEGQEIDVNTCATGEVDIAAASQGVNRLSHTVSDVWILNTDDLTFGVHDVNITANIVTRQVGPLLSNGSAEYLYLGCYFDGSGRQLSKQYNNATNENGWCQTQCMNNGYKFAGTEYHTECWCGNNPPSYLRYQDPSLNKCTFSCPGDTTQACGGDGTFISIYYDRTKYTPDGNAVPGLGGNVTVTTTTTTSTVATTSSTVVTTTGSSSTGGSGSTASTTTTTTSAAASPTIPQSIGAYTYVGCYTEGTSSRALTAKTLAVDSMTVELCYQTCNGYTWFGLEYHRECYCGNSLSAGSALSTSGNICNDPCLGNPGEYCGGSSRLQMYNNLAAANSSSSSTTTTTTATTTSSAVSTTVTTTTTTTGSTSTTDSGSSSSSSVTVDSSSTVATSTTSSSAAPTTTTTTTSPTTTPSAPPTTTTTSPSAPPTTTSATTTTTAPTTLSTTTTTTATTTATSSSASASSTVPTILGFEYVGCFSDPAGGPFVGHNMPKLFTNDSMTPELCISSALARRSATPATTFLFAGVEYGRECYAGTMAPTPEPTSLTGNRACTMTCKGNSSLSCGAGNQYNLYAATSATLIGTGTGVWTVPPQTTVTGSPLP